jgi:hypothetical protein
MSLKQAIAFWKLGLLSSEQLPAIAAEALEVGFDCPSLRVLAGETDHIASTVDPLFSRAIDELRIPIPDHRSAAKVVAARYAAGILDGTWSPYEGARKIWWNVAHAFDNDPEIWGHLSVFVGLASEWEDDQMHRPEYEKEIHAAAATVVRTFEDA